MTDTIQESTHILTDTIMSTSQNKNTKMFSEEPLDRLNLPKLKNINSVCSERTQLPCRIIKLKKERTLSRLPWRKSINSILDQDEFFKNTTKYFI